MKVLLIEDNRELRECLELSLNDHGLQVVAANSPDDAVEKMADGEFDSAVIDSVLRDTDGIAVAQLIRKKAGNSFPILLTSSISTSLARRMAADQNCQFIAKPFSISQLADEIRSLR